MHKTATTPFLHEQNDVFPATTSENYSTDSPELREQPNLPIKNYVVEITIASIESHEIILSKFGIHIDLQSTQIITRRNGPLEFIINNGKIKWAYTTAIDRTVKTNQVNQVNPLCYRQERIKYLLQHGCEDLLTFLEIALGEDRHVLLEKLFKKLDVSLKKLSPSQKQKYPQGTFSHKDATLPTPPSIIYDPRTKASWIQEKRTEITDSSGNIASIVFFYRYKNQVSMLPYYAHSENIFPCCRSTRSTNCNFRLGLSKISFQLTHRKELKENPEALVFLAQDIYEAEKINEALEKKGIPGAIATSWLGGSDCLHYSDFSYLYGRQVIIGLNNSLKQATKKLAEEILKHEITALQLKQNLNDFLKLLFDETTPSKAIIQQLNSLTPYNKRQSQRKEKCPQRLKQQLPIRITTSDDLITTQPTSPQESYWEDIIRPDSLTLVCGPTEVGKTMFLYTLALALRNNLRFLDISSHKNLNILYIDAESAKREASIRRNRIKAALGECLTPIDLILRDDSPEPINLDDENWRQHLSEIIVQYDVVILDNLLSLANKTVRNPAHWKKFTTWCNNLPAAVILVHHDNKEGDVLGITEIQALTPTVIHLSKDNSLNNFSGVAQLAKFSKCKAIPRLSGKGFKLSLETENNTPWHVMPLNDAEATPSDENQVSLQDYDLSQLDEKELKVFKELKSLRSFFRRTDIEKIAKQGRSSAQNIIKKFIELKLVISEGQGKGISYAVAPPHNPS